VCRAVLEILRLTRGVRQRELARKTGIIRNYLLQAESGTRNPQGDELARIAKFYGVPADDLLSHVADPKNGEEAADTQRERHD
jgi:transcriptional regulator with XRE-family HTH domain